MHDGLGLYAGEEKEETMTMHVWLDCNLNTFFLRALHLHVTTCVWNIATVLALGFPQSMWPVIILFPAETAIIILIIFY